MNYMPILASDAYPGKQITPASYAKSKKSAIMFTKSDSATLMRHHTQSSNTLSPSTKTTKQEYGKKVTKHPRKQMKEMRELKELKELQALEQEMKEVRELK